VGFSLFARTAESRDGLRTRTITLGTFHAVVGIRRMVGERSGSLKLCEGFTESATGAGHSEEVKEEVMRTRESWMWIGG